MDEITAAGALIATEAIKSLAKDMVSFLKEKIVRYYQDTTNKESVDSGLAFQNYMEKTYSKYSKSKSILYGTEAHNLSSFFVPTDISLQYDTYNGQKRGLRKVYYTDNKMSTKLVGEVLNKGSKIIITGIGGMGKTMLMKYFCVNAIETGYKVPVFISMRWFNELLKDEPFEKMIYEQLQNLGFELPYDYFKYSLESNKYLFLLDGFDEINEEKIVPVSLKLEEFTMRYAENSFILSSRPNEQVFGWDDYKIYTIKPLTLEQAVELISKQDLDEYMKERFIYELNNGLYEKYETFTSVPLLLSILFLTYDTNTVIPETLSEFYEKAFETMLFRHDKRKIGFNRILKSGLSYSIFKKVFMRFCFRTYFNNAYSFSYDGLIREIHSSLRKEECNNNPEYYVSDIVNISCLLIKDGLEFIFIHRSFQEYFAAAFLAQETEQKQNQLCTTFIKDEMDSFDEISSKKFLGIRNIQYSRCIEFLEKLYYIEPNRFEYAILQPIRKKLLKLYRQCNNNLLVTASKLVFIERGVFIHEETGEAESYWNFTGYYYSEHYINMSELIVLDNFHWILPEMKHESEKNIVRSIIDSNNDLLERYLFDSEKYRNASAYQSRYILTKIEDINIELSKIVLAFFLEELERYNKMKEQDSAEGSLQEIVNKF